MKFNLTGEYKSDVREEDPNERPIVGQSKSMRCYNSEENKGNPEAGENAVRWMRNGHTVQNDARHEGASTRVRYRLLCVVLMSLIQKSVSSFPVIAIYLYFCRFSS